MKVLREREREVFRQIKTLNRMDMGDLQRFWNEELAEKSRSRRDLTRATAC